MVVMVGSFMVERLVCWMSNCSVVRLVTVVICFYFVCQFAKNGCWDFG